MTVHQRIMRYVTLITVDLLAIDHQEVGMPGAASPCSLAPRTGSDLSVEDYIVELTQGTDGFYPAAPVLCGKCRNIALVHAGSIFEEPPKPAEPAA
jgi:hypothetical protein